MSKKKYKFVFFRKRNEEELGKLSIEDDGIRHLVDISEESADTQYFLPTRRFNPSEFDTLHCSLLKTFQASAFIVSGTPDEVRFTVQAGLPVGVLGVIDTDKEDLGRLYPTIAGL